MVERLSAGRPFKDVAKQLGYSLIGLSNLRSRESLSKRSPKTAIRLQPKFSQTTEYQQRKRGMINDKLIEIKGEKAIDEIKQDLFNGASIKNIARQLNLPENTLFDWLKVLKISKKSVWKEVYEKAKKEHILDRICESTKLVLILYFDGGLNMVQVAQCLHNQGRQITRQGVSDLIHRHIHNLNKRLIK